METVVYMTFAVLAMISLVSQVILHLQLQECKKELANFQTVAADLQEAQEIKQIHLEHYARERHRTKQQDTSRRRHRRNRNQCHVPHFFLLGYDRISENGVFYWLNRDLNNDAFGVVQEYVYDTDQSALDGLLINHAGVYFISAQVHVRGRDNTLGSIPLNPSVGLSLKRRRGSQRVWTSVANDDTLNSVFITQDNIGRSYRSGKYPVDVLQLSGLYLLEEDDVIYISRPLDDLNNDQIIYENHEDFGHFSGILIEPRGPCHSG